MHLFADACVNTLAVDEDAAVYLSMTERALRLVSSVPETTLGGKQLQTLSGNLPDFLV